MNKSDRKFSVGDFVYVKSVKKYGEILDIIKTPSGRTGYRLDIDDLVYFEEEFESTNTYEQAGKVFVDYIKKLYCCHGKRKISYFELIHNPDGTIDFVIYFGAKPVQDEYIVTDLIKTVAELEKDKATLVKQEWDTKETKWIKYIIRKGKMDICIDEIEEIFSSFRPEVEIVTLKSLMDHYLEQLHNTNDPAQKEQYNKALIRIGNQLKQLEYF